MCHWQKGQSPTRATQGEPTSPSGGSRGGPPPLLLDQTETRKAENCFLHRPPPPTCPPLISGSRWPYPPLSEGRDSPLSPTFPYKSSLSAFKWSTYPSDPLVLLWEVVVLPSIFKKCKLSFQNARTTNKHIFASVHQNNQVVSGLQFVNDVDNARRK